MKKYLIVLKGKQNIGKTNVLKLLIRELKEKYKKFESYEIYDCEYVKKDLNDVDEKKDIFCSFDISKKNKIIVSTGGDYLKCIETFLNKFKNEDALIGITACQCSNVANSKYKIITKFVEENKNIELIEITNNINNEYRHLLNRLKAKEIFHIIEHLAIYEKK